MSALVIWAATALGVRDPGAWREWLACLLFLPPSQRPALPPPLAARLAPVTGYFAEELGVRPTRRLRDWLLALLWRSARARARRRPSLIAKLIRAALRLPLVPLTFLEAQLDRVDFAPVEDRLEALASRAPLARPLAGALALMAALPLLLMWVTTPLTIGQQAFVFVAVWLLSMVLRRFKGRMPTLLLMGFSLLATGRYAWWRLTQTLVLDPGPDLFLGLGLVAAEAYAWLILVLGFIQSAWPLDRRAVVLPADPEVWPTVDVYIPTYNEPLKVVKPTVLAALSMDWPRDKINIYLLDDGRRDSFRSFAKEVGIQYLRRADNSHAKAGNLNNALKLTRGELIAIFDCDHIPVRSFLQMSVGWLREHPRCALVQTPHHFFSPDPFERNLDTFGRVPNEGSLFYGLVQDGNDLWDASFFCGSCAVIRRTALEQVGGIAVETVTEDAHTSLKMHRLGWTSAYLRLTQAAGLATESLSAHIGQRIRWARGMAQIFRLDNPLFGPGLKLFQRLCYANAMLHFFNGLPRLVFLTSPLAFLYFGFHVINAPAAAIAIYVLPHLVQASLANSRAQGRFRFSFWAEAYESVLAWYIALPTTMALINPRAGIFNVTAKGGLVQQDYFDWSIALPYLMLVLLNTAGVLIALLRLFYWGGAEPGTVLMNGIWALANTVMMGAALGVAAEARQVRVSQRVALRIPACLYLPNGHVIACETENYSAGGLGIAVPDGMQIPIATRLHIGLLRGTVEHAFSATAVVLIDGHLGLRFETLSIEDERRLLECTFGRADAWANPDAKEPTDHALQSLFQVLRFGVVGYGRALSSLAAAFPFRRASPESA